MLINNININSIYIKIKNLYKKLKIIKKFIKDQINKNQINKNH